MTGFHVKYFCLNCLKVFLGIREGSYEPMQKFDDNNYTIF